MEYQLETTPLCHIYKGGMYMKKKKIIIISLAIIIAIILILISGYIFIMNRLSIKGIIVEYYESDIYSNYIDVYEEDKKTITTIILPENINLKFKPGQEVRVYLSYNTVIMDTYPASIDSEFIKKIKIIKENGNTQIVEEYNTQKQERLLQLRDLEQKLNRENN